jgi:hypothetical protein
MIKYFIRFKAEYESIPKALEAYRLMGCRIDTEISYQVNYPVFKNWVPTWLVNMITNSPINP